MSIKMGRVQVYIGRRTKAIQCLRRPTGSDGVGTIAVAVEVVVVIVAAV